MRAHRPEDSKQTAPRRAGGEAPRSLARWAVVLVCLAALLSVTIPVAALEGPAARNPSPALASGSLSQALPERDAEGNGDGSPQLALRTNYFTKNAGQLESPDVRFYLASRDLQVALTVVGLAPLADGPLHQQHRFTGIPAADINWSSRYATQASAAVSLISLAKARRSSSCWFTGSTTLSSTAGQVVTSGHRGIAPR